MSILTVDENDGGKEPKDVQDEVRNLVDEVGLGCCGARSGFEGVSRICYPCGDIDTSVFTSLGVCGVI